MKLNGRHFPLEGTVSGRKLVYDYDGMRYGRLIIEREIISEFWGGGGGWDEREGRYSTLRWLCGYQIPDLGIFYTVYLRYLWYLTYFGT